MVQRMECFQSVNSFAQQQQWTQNIKGKKGVRGNNRLEYIFRYFTDTDNPNKFLTGPDFILIHQCWSLVKMINVKAQEEEQDS